jgi:hypothetical protein
MNVADKKRLLCEILFAWRGSQTGMAELYAKETGVSRARGKKEERMWSERDPVIILRDRLIDAGEMTKEDYRAHGYRDPRRYRE